MCPEPVRPGGDWYSVTRRCTLRLTRIRSVSPGAGEDEAAREVVRLLHEGGLEGAYADSGLDPLPGDPYGRHNAYAYLQGRSRRTVVLFGHIDTVGTADYGELEPWALDPEGLAARQGALTATLPDVTDDLAQHPGDWMFGRGVADMKGGVAATIAVMRRLAAMPPGERPLSVVLLATPDEENESAGILQAVHFLNSLRERHGLDYAGAINTDYSTAHYPGDPHRYIYAGTVGKLLPALYAVGRAAHAGAPFDGVDANLLLAELVRDLSMDATLCDVVGDHVAPPPVTLRATDLKTHYDTQLPLDAYAYFNVVTLTTEPAALLAALRERAEAALSRVLARLDEAERRWTGTGGGTGRPPRQGTVLTYANLHAETVERLGEGRVRAVLADAWESMPVNEDRRERSLRLVRRLWTLSGGEGPAVIIFYAPPYYPHLAPAPCALHDAARAVAAAHPELKLVVRGYFPLLSDMSYLRRDPGVDLAVLRENMPVWQDWQESDRPTRPGSYTLPLEAMARLDLPVINLGPYGRGVHQRGERALMSYSFGVVPRLIYETIERLTD